MKAFSAAMCLVAVLAGAYCYLGPLPLMKAEFRCLYRFETLHSGPAGQSASFPTESQVQNDPSVAAKYYADAVDDAHGLARHNRIMYPLSVVLCALLFISGLVGLASVARARQLAKTRRAS